MKFFDRDTEWNTSLPISVVCDTPLGMDISNPTIPEENIHPSSLAPGIEPGDVRLNGPVAWSPHPGDNAPYVMIDLGKPSDVTGVLIQGGGPGTDKFVTQFFVTYSTDDETYLPIEIDNEPVVSLTFLTTKAVNILRNARR